MALGSRRDDEVVTLLPEDPQQVVEVMEVAEVEAPIIFLGGLTGRRRQGRASLKVGHKVRDTCDGSSTMLIRFSNWCKARSSSVLPVEFGNDCK